MNKIIPNFTASILLFSISGVGMCSKQELAQTTMSECLTQLSLRADKRLEWLFENTRFTPGHPDKPFIRYGEYLMHNARIHRLFSGIGSSADSIEKVENLKLKSVGFNLLSIFEKPSQQCTMQDRKIIERNKEDFDTLLREHLSEKGKKRYAENPEQFAKRFAQEALFIIIFDLIGQTQ